MKEKLFRVKWEIDVYGHNPEEAARQAFACMQAQHTSSCCFEVAAWPGYNFVERKAKWKSIDLNQKDNT